MGRSDLHSLPCLLDYTSPQYMAPFTQELCLITSGLKVLHSGAYSGAVKMPTMQLVLSFQRVANQSLPKKQSGASDQIFICVSPGIIDILSLVAPAFLEGTEFALSMQLKV